MEEYYIFEKEDLWYELQDEKKVSNYEVYQKCEEQYIKYR